ncbi:tetratricopeptide repeat protein [uncultured Flavobacterium sp.]|uniref:tetratricopeptide repeat protein n=1 Tax=uncultured Flavobacterium sp. TaxID=165435 RepID=UPI0030CA5102|tara:strand:+ start:787 stop:1482 length:696 start_codon:yes stop_codon:yes gene_type:complete
MYKLVIYILLIISSWVSAQEDHKALFKGNESFNGKKYTLSETNYRVSASTDTSVKSASNYNLGNSIYRLNQPGEAKFKFLEASTTATTKKEKHQAFHNLGNSLMLEKNYQAAVEAYKNALRNNPNDEQTRYNYALAKKMLKENPPKSGGGDDKDKNKDKDNKKDPEKKDQDQNKQNKDGDKEEKGNQKPQGADKQKIENILEAVNNAEKKIQDKLNAKKEKGVRIQTDKDW